ncbi:class I SAM-dependent methyltransferase [Henriciella aquimarina]|uniref:class I SAM-dependent methyltransferase n=1 Tax=Henriciella aquimarina TaxID=545261 RepID=UPI0009FF37D4|nr:methyltransferase domain-containing protein [Henriciella aquimarina]
MTRLLTASLLALAVAACGQDSPATDAPEAPTPPPTDESAETPPAETGETDTAEAGSYTVEDAMAGSWRSEDEKARDQYRHPAETLEFLGIEGDDTVIEIWPGGGWYTNILAPWLNANGGQLVAATYNPERSERTAEVVQEFKDNYAGNPDTFGTIEYVVFDGEAEPMGEPESADAVLTFRNIHNWMSGDYADKFFNEAYRVLKPGGTLGVVEHRLPSSAEQDPSAPSGYVHEDYVRQLAETAGFEFVEASEVNANPDDTADHPFGVWTLPPVSRTTDGDGNTPDGFDAQSYLDIGESDRMTLKFVKPAGDDAMDGGAEDTGTPEDE